MKKGLKITLITVAAVIATLFIAVFCIWGGEIRTLNSIEQVGDNCYLMQMDYLADYDLDDVVNSDIDSYAKLTDYIIAKVGKGLPISIHSSQIDGEQVTNCTSFQARKADGEGYWYGRNYDFYKNPTMITYSKPKKGYASVSGSDMSHFGYGLDNMPDGFTSKIMCLAAIYTPLDGINEKGLCTSIMALPHQAACQNTGKHIVSTTIIMRLFLDKCATVDEALELLSTVDIRHDAHAGSGYHYMVADANGDCAIIEFDKDDEWKTIILRKDPAENSMLITNHLLNPKHRTLTPDPSVGNPASMSWERYEKAGAFLAENNGTLTFDQMQECLAMVRWVDLPQADGTFEDTQYSNVYDQKDLKLYLKNWNEYDKTYEFQLKK